MVVPPGHAPFLRLGPVLAVVVVLAAIFVFTAYANRAGNVARSGPGDTSGAGETAGARAGGSDVLEVGGCAQLTSADGRLVPVPAPCDQPGRVRVVAATSSGTPCPAPSRGFDLPEERIRLCLVE